MKAVVRTEKLGVFALMLIFGLFSADLPFSSAQTIFNVLDYGAKADGKTDDSNAFSAAWKAACSAATQNPTVVVPSSKDFLVYPLTFQGPCKSSNISFQVIGTINAPSSPSVWRGRNARRWLIFHGVTGLLITGNGTFNGHGSEWWDLSCSDHPSMVGCATIIPVALNIIHCKHSTISDIYTINSARYHVVVNQSSDILVKNMHITAPESSPNTDGIHIELSQNVLVNNSVIATGDDCVSIGELSSNINVSYVTCGPGHGVSIGSLGRYGNSVKVENIHVKKVNFKGTTNGVRIKTWQIGLGYARKISFEHITLESVKNPIYIDQNYCNNFDGTRGNCEPKSTGVHISEVTYDDIVGTSSSNAAIYLNCSQSVACTGITLSNIKIESNKSGQQVTSECTNAHGTDSGVVQPKSCLQS
uniref:endo-polygalacturonase n=1 Tax=Quercus lobata TaxID=97700 RepID=A0A7N2MPQ8_QUELO